MLVHIAIGLAAVLYLSIGVFIGALSWRLWEASARTRTTLFLFPVSHVTGTGGQLSTDWGHVLLHKDMARGLYLWWLSIIWPLTILWFPLAMIGMTSVWCLVALFSPIGWAIRQIVSAASKLADGVANPKLDGKPTQKLMVTPAPPVKLRVELVKERDRLAAEYQRAETELEEFERERAAAIGHNVHRVNPDVE